MQYWIKTFLLIGMAVGLVAFAVAACGGSESESDTTEGPEDPEEGLAAAREGIAPYVGQPSAFPVTEELERIPSGARIAYMNSGSPLATLTGEYLAEAAEAMGVRVTDIKAGPEATTVRTGFDAVLARQPDAVIVNAVPMELWQRQAEQLDEDGIPVITFGVLGTEPFGVNAPQAAEEWARVTGRLVADYVTAEFGTDSNVVFYGVPELPFSNLMEEAFGRRLEEVCPNCSMRTAEIRRTTIANTAPDRVVADLQANRETTVAVFATDQAQIGLPSKLRVAGIEVKTIGAAPTPVNLQYLKDGVQTAAVGYDLPVQAWQLLDQAAREIIGQQLSGPAAEGLPPMQTLTQGDITFDPEIGWTGYPDYAERFARLWGSTD